MSNTPRGTKVSKIPGIIGLSASDVNSRYDDIATSNGCSISYRKNL